MKNHDFLKLVKGSLGRWEMCSRVAYLCIAALWLVLLKKQIVISPWDAVRVNLPPAAYVAVPAAVLIIYAVIPSIKTWVIVIATLSTGWGLHFHRSLRNDFANLDDKSGIVVVFLPYLAIFLLCVSVLYLLGPFLLWIERKKKNITLG